MEQTKRYSLELTEYQAKLLSWACDEFSRIICGQDWSIQTILEMAWEKRAMSSAGDAFDKEFEGGWSKMREETNVLVKDIKKRYWGLDRSTMNGIHYDDRSDALYDIHQVIRHQLWLDQPEEKRQSYVNDAYEAHQFSSQELPIIKRI